jgi:hypothetical protein
MYIIGVSDRQQMRKIITFCLNLSSYDDYSLNIRFRCKIILLLLLITGDVDPGEKLTTGVLDTGDQFVAGVIDTGEKFDSLAMYDWCR